MEMRIDQPESQYQDHSQTETHNQAIRIKHLGVRTCNEQATPSRPLVALPPTGQWID